MGKNRAQENRETESLVTTSLTKREREDTKANAIKELRLARSRIKMRMTGLNLSEAMSESTIKSTTKAATAVMMKLHLSSRREEASVISQEVEKEEALVEKGKAPTNSTKAKEVAVISTEEATEEEVDFLEELKEKLSEAPESKEAETAETEVDSEMQIRIDVIKPLKFKA